MNVIAQRQLAVLRGLDELYRFVWERTADSARTAEDRGDVVELGFALGTLRSLERTRSLLDGRSIGSHAAEHYLRRAARAHSDHPAFQIDWLL